MKRLAIAFALTAGCAASRPPPPDLAQAAAVPDRVLGLSKTSASDVPAPPPIKENTSSPGERPALPRAYPGAPPRIPHGIRDLLPITRDGNACVDCHAVKEKKPGEPTPIPASHYTDLRREPGKPGDHVLGARWVCISCHVPQTGAAPLVKNRFGS